MGVLAAILGAPGALLLLVGLLGGGFEISGSVIPRVGRASRVLCFGFGGAMVLIAVVLAVAEGLPAPFPNPGPAPTADSAPPAVGYIVAGSGYTATVFELPTLDSLTLADVPDGTEVHILCTAQGDVVISPVTGLASSLWNYTTDGGFIPDVMVDTGTFEPVMPSCPS